MTENLVITESKSGEKISEEAIREALSRVLQSSMFAQSDRLSRFLRFTVEATLAGDAEMLKEYSIGTEVYERNSSYHPSEDSIVRSEARRLRSRLKEYYESVGKDDPVFIHYRPGSYVPGFRHQRSQHDDRIATDRALGELFAGGLGMQALAIPAMAGKLNVQIVFEGTVHVIRPGSRSSTPTDFGPGQTFKKRNQIRKVVSMSRETRIDANWGDVNRKQKSGRKQ